MLSFLSPMMKILDHFFPINRRQKPTIRFLFHFGGR